jgi:hypothetical protein
LLTKHAANYANQLLSDLGEATEVQTQADHPAVAWRRSGLYHITGKALPIPLASHADGVLMALKAITDKNEGLPETGSQLLGERALVRDIQCEPLQNAGGSARVLQAVDGWFALNLAREDDWDLMPAWLECETLDWASISKTVRQREAQSMVKRGVEMGLAIGESVLPALSPSWYAAKYFKTKKCKMPLVVDLSGLWAGPLASSLLQMLGAKVIKIESPHRPDGLRSGHQGFYDLINAGKDCVSLDFHNRADLAQFKHLLHQADVVIEASRPRAFQQLGIIAEKFVSAKPGKVWARLTAYGQAENRIGFGDDIGFSAGLSSIMQDVYGAPDFVGDAIADPISGIHLALVIQSSLNNGGGAVIDLSMRDIMRYAMGDLSGDLTQKAESWAGLIAADKAPFYSHRNPAGFSKSQGADNAAWL